MSQWSLEDILHPKSVAIVGASTNPIAQGYNFTRYLIEQGFGGKIYPVHPRYPEVLGLKAYPTVKEIPGPVDYVISCVPSTEVLNLLEECSQKGVRCLHLFTARFSETGRQDAAELEQQILKQARKLGIRLIGPNCLGVYYPQVGLSFGYDFPAESGAVGFASQSGGGATGFVRLAGMRGVRFSKVFSYGNALDFNECDYLDYFAHDPETKTILMYIEGLKNGKKFFDLLRRVTPVKPVVIIKGGRGQSGMRAASSHTAALAGSMKIWETAVGQAGAVSARTFDELADLAVTFNFSPPILGRRVGVAGGGGGPSVLAADDCEEAGLEVIPLPAEIREELKSKNVSIWDWIGNPADVSIMGGSGVSGIDLLQMMAKNKNFDLIILLVNEDAPFQKDEMMRRRREEIKVCLSLKKKSKKPLLVVAGEKSTNTENYNHWRWKSLSQVRAKLIPAGIPVYPTVDRAARTARKVLDYYRNLK
ncbi:MAG: CoA-binding protein [Chloroflexota bacterium]